MTRRPNFCPMSLEDMESGNELLRAPLGFCPQIDKETRMILGALLDDMFNHLHAHHDPEKCEEAWASAQFMHDILSDILNRTPENTKVPDTLEWLRPLNKTTPATEKEKTAMAYENDLDTDDIDALLDPVFELNLDKLQHVVLVHMEGKLQILLSMVQDRYDQEE